MEDKCTKYPCNDIEVLKKLLYGNGLTGLIEKIEELYSQKEKQDGMIRLLKWLLPLLGIATLKDIIKMFI